MKKEVLVIYANGARGDFLSSILVGNKLTESYRSLQILRGNDNAPMIKMHRFGESYNCSIRTIDDLKKYCTVRVSIDNPKNAYLIACLAFYKHAIVEKKPNVLKVIGSKIKYQLGYLEGLTTVAWQTEMQYRKLDDYIDHRIPFWDLFDVDKIDDFYYQINAERLTPEEKDRIQHNIDINLELIEQLRLTYMVDTQS